MTSSFSVSLTDVTMAHGMGILSDLSYRGLNSPDTGILFKKWKKLHKQVSYECLSVLIGRGRELRAGCVREHEEVGLGVYVPRLIDGVAPDGGGLSNPEVGNFL